VNAAADVSRPDISRSVFDPAVLERPTAARDEDPEDHRQRARQDHGHDDDDAGG
jgi:hypothetical protein